MPFRLSELLRNGRSSVQHDTDSRRPPSRPLVVGGTHNFSPSRPAPQPPSLPNRDETRTPASFTYDNGTGRLDPRLMREQGLPLDMKTTDQLAAFIRDRSRGHDEPSSPDSLSRYSYDDMSLVDDCRSETELPRGSFDLPRRASQSVRRPFNPTVVGLRNKYGAARPIVRILPGTRRKHQYEGYWLRRGTTRKIPVEAEDKSRHAWWKKKEPMVQDRYVETSGWYDD